MTDTVRLTMPAKAEYLILARLALAGIAREVPMSESALADLKLAVTEVCGNAVRHAYGAEETGPVRLSFEVGSDSIQVTVEDDGTGIGLELPERISIGEEPVEEGMGLAIIRAVVDDLTVDGRPDGRPGTVVRLAKSLAG